MRPAAVSKNPAAQRITVRDVYTLVFGLFLGLAIAKFGNPVILDKIILSPKNWTDLWPLHWANWMLLTLAVFGAGVALGKKPRWQVTRWLWVLPLVWFGWQVLSAVRSSYPELTTVTLWQYGGCLACYFIGIFVIGPGRRWFVLIGIMLGFAFCLVRGVNQKLIEFPREKQTLIESQQSGWTNIAPDVLLEWKQDGVIIHTNGVYIVNPVFMAKYEKGRALGTLFYPNTFAGVILLLLPVALVIVWQITRRLKRLICVLAMGLTIFLGLGGLFWSGSKSGWLIALAAGVFWLYRLKWSRQLKWAMVTVLLIGGLAVFAVRFQSYFAKGATSVGARFDYWRAAAEVTKEHPMFGTGPGTFQHPYGVLKRPESEMARLVHNDYLEQFSDSGIIGGLSYAAWIALLFWVTGRRIWAAGDWLEFGILTGLLAWFAQGFIEFSLFVPALAWTAFTLAGSLLAEPVPGKSGRQTKGG